MPEANEVAGPVMINVEASKKLGGNWKTQVLEEAGGGMVVKIDKKIGLELTREQGETFDSYYQRRLKAGFDFIKRETADDQKLRAHLPEGLSAPKEFYFIMDGADGFPVVARSQEKANGRMLKDIDITTLSPANKKVLDSLVDASLNCYIRTGKILDITGWSGADEGKFKWLAVSIGKPIAESSNIFLDENDNLVLIDLKSSFPGDSVARKVGRFIHFAGLLSYRVIDKIKNRQTSIRSTAQGSV